MNLDKQFANNVFFTILLLNNKPISVCRFILFDNRKTIFCSRQVLTIEKYRQKGYAKKVLNEGFLFLSKNYSCKKVISYIDKDNEASLILHKKAGYVKKEKNLKYYIKNRFAFKNCIIMEKTK